ncbi:DinB family protein [Terriglobus sp. ADX1]|uniref:DinB family protein n=1 Tax=Terriglobus sp. ADX1 TaxID=2794063 RepID=UPI002FE6789B
MSAGLSGEELLAWNDTTFVRWMELVKRHPEILRLSCDVYGVGDINGLLHHIVAAELRYAQRLFGEVETAYEDIPADVAGMEAAHVGMLKRVRELFADATFDWEQAVSFQTRSMGSLRASRRTVLNHTLLHGIRHYAQMAMLVRQGGIAPGWPMDYLFMGVMGRE